MNRILEAPLGLLLANLMVRNRFKKLKGSKSLNWATFSNKMEVVQW